MTLAPCKFPTLMVLRFRTDQSPRKKMGLSFLEKDLGCQTKWWRGGTILIFLVIFFWRVFLKSLFRVFHFPEEKWPKKYRNLPIFCLNLAWLGRNIWFSGKTNMENTFFAFFRKKPFWNYQNEPTLGQKWYQTEGKSLVTLGGLIWQGWRTLYLKFSKKGPLQKSEIFFRKFGKFFRKRKIDWKFQANKLGLNKKPSVRLCSYFKSLLSHMQSIESVKCYFALFTNFHLFRDNCHLNWELPS